MTRSNHASTHRRRIYGAWLCVGLITAVRTASAQSNTGDVPLGGRSTLLGGTGVALGRDGASPFLNPATMGRIADQRLAFSVHFYRYARTSVDDLIRAPHSLDARSSDVSQGAISIQPSSFCAFITLSGLIPEEAQGLWQTVRGNSGRTKLGLCGANIEREQYTLNAESRNFDDGTHHARVAYNLVHSWQRQSIGPSISYQLSKRLTLGATLQVITSSVSQSWDLAALVDNTEGHVYQHHLQGNAIDGVTTLGVTWVNRRLTLGVAARLPSVNVSNSARLTQYVSSPNTTPRLLAGKGTFEAPLMPNLSVGAGAEWEKTSFEFDVSTSFDTSPGLRTTLTVTEGEEAPSRKISSHDALRPTVAFRLGGERYLSPSLSVLAGARYEPANIRNGFAQPAFRLGPMNRNLVAGSVGFGSYGRGTEILLGFELSHSFGKMPIVSALNGDAAYAETRYGNTSLLVVLSGSVGLSAVKRTWQNLTELSPKK